MRRSISVSASSMKARFFLATIAFAVSGESDNCFAMDWKKICARLTQKSSPVEPKAAANLTEDAIAQIVHDTMERLEGYPHAVVVFQAEISKVSGTAVDQALRTHLADLRVKGAVAAVVEMEPQPSGSDLRAQQLVNEVRRQFPEAGNPSGRNGLSDATDALLQAMYAAGATEEVPLIVFVPGFVPRSDRFEEISSWLRGLAQQGAESARWLSLRIVITSRFENLGSAQGYFNVGASIHAEGYAVPSLGTIR